jgi:hypothetical protein
VQSSVSPERAETIVRQPATRAASKAAFVSLSVPAWFGLISAVLQAPAAAAARMRAALVTRKSSPTTRQRAPTARVKATMPSASVSATGSSIATMRYSSTQRASIAPSAAASIVRSSRRSL